MIHLLHGYCGKNPKLWDEKLPYVKHAYNKAMHSSTQSSLFETCFGYFTNYPLDMAFEKDEYSSEKTEREKAQNFIEWN